MKTPVTLQLLTQVADGAFWLYEREVVLQAPPEIGRLLRGYGIPNVLGPEHMADNVIRRIIDAEDRPFLLVALHGFRDPTLDVREMDAQLRGWKRHPEPPARSPSDHDGEDEDATGG